MSSSEPLFCGRCGDPILGDHDCRVPVGDLDPDRFCTRCGRRLDVQVFPTTVRATCRSCDGVHPAHRSEDGRAR